MMATDYSIFHCQRGDTVSEDRGMPWYHGNGECVRMNLGPVQLIL